MAQQVQAWKCSYCGKTGTEVTINHHEPKCKNAIDARQKAHNEYVRKTSERTAKAIEMAQKSPGIKLLVEAGLLDDAHTLCRELTCFMWDCGTSDGYTKMYNEMIKSVQ